MRVLHAFRLAAAWTLLVAVAAATAGCGKAGDGKPKIVEVGVVESASCDAMLPMCEKLGLAAKHCCDLGAAANSCKGSVVRLTLSSADATSNISAQDCLDQLHGTIDTYCSGTGRPGDCTGSCGANDCVNTGETTDGQTTQNGPPTWKCSATKGRCYCDCP